MLTPQDNGWPGWPCPMASQEDMGGGWCGMWRIDIRGPAPHQHHDLRLLCGALVVVQVSDRDL